MSDYPEDVMEAAKEAAALGLAEAGRISVVILAMSLDDDEPEVLSAARAITAERERAKPRVKPLDFVEGRNDYWSAQDGYQIAFCGMDIHGNSIWRVRLHGKVVCRNIKSFERAVAWANEHHERRILSALEGHDDG